MTKKTFYFLIITALIVIGTFNWSKTQDINHDVKIIEVDTNQLQNALLSTVNDPDNMKLIIVYASWCRSCAQNFSLINNLISNTNNIKTLIISIDGNINNLQKLLTKEKKINFTPYNISPTNKNMYNLANDLKNIGTVFTQRIPYIAVIGKDNKVLVDGCNVKQLKMIIESTI